MFRLSPLSPLLFYVHDVIFFGLPSSLLFLYKYRCTLEIRFVLLCARPYVMPDFAALTAGTLTAGVLLLLSSLLFLWQCD